MFDNTLKPGQPQSDSDELVVAAAAALDSAGPSGQGQPLVALLGLPACRASLPGNVLSRP